MLEQVLSGAKTGNLCGVDAVPGRWMDLTAKAAVSLEKRTGAVVVMTGTTDVVAGPERVMKIMNGHPWMGRITGCVRDLLLGRTPGDFDVCTDARPERVMELFPHTVPTGLRHGTVTVRTEDGPVEVTTFRREGGYADGRHPDAVDFDATLAEDLARRDFTVNAMALDAAYRYISSRH